MRFSSLPIWITQHSSSDSSLWVKRDFHEPISPLLPETWWQKAGTNHSGIILQPCRAWGSSPYSSSLPRQVTGWTEGEYFLLHLFIKLFVGRVGHCSVCPARQFNQLINEHEVKITVWNTCKLVSLAVQSPLYHYWQKKVTPSHPKGDFTAPAPETSTKMCHRNADFLLENRSPSHVLWAGSTEVSKSDFWQFKCCFLQSIFYFSQSICYFFTTRILFPHNDTLGIIGGCSRIPFHILSSDAICVALLIAI